MADRLKTEALEHSREQGGMLEAIASAAALDRRRPHRRLAFVPPPNSFRLWHHRSHDQRHNRSNCVAARLTGHGCERMGRSLAVGSDPKILENKSQTLGYAARTGQFVDLVSAGVVDGSGANSRRRK